MPGPAAAPAQLRVLGGRGKGRDSGGRKVEEPPPFVRLPPEPPDALTPVAREEWERVVPGLARLRLLTPEHQAGLVAYCESVATHRAATAKILEHGITVVNKSLTKAGDTLIRHAPNPAVAAQHQASNAIRQWAAEFGLTPAAESKVKVPEANDGGNSNPFADRAQNQS